MEITRSKRGRLHLSVCCLFCTVAGVGQQAAEPIAIPPHFTLDVETGARLRPQLMAQSVAPDPTYLVALEVFNRLIADKTAAHDSSSSKAKFSWQLRIVENGQLNAYSSPDGAIYVESGLADLAGPSPGLWAAILSHEIAHVVRRDWARRYLYQKMLESGNGAAILLGDPGLPEASWKESGKASADLGLFCRRMELDADREGLMLMARAGFHPDFVPALHHLLHARSRWAATSSLYAMHPCWEERDQELARSYVDAAILFTHLWPEWYASPGGNPPVVVFADPPVVRRTGADEWQIRVPLHCENLAGAVEVVVRAESNAAGSKRQGRPTGPGDSNAEMRQLTGCMRPETTVTFVLGDPPKRTGDAGQWTDVYVLDARGAVLTRADLPKH